MKKTAVLVILLPLAGCGTAPVTPKFAPPATAQPAVTALQTSRVISVPYESVFPKILDVLVDHGFLVRSANSQLGVISLYQQWADSGQGDATITTEGTILLHAMPNGTTQVKLALTGSWQLETVGGGKSLQTSMIGGASQFGGNDQYRQMLDLIEQGLAAH